MLTRLFVAASRVAKANSQLEELRPILQEIQDAERERAELRPKLQTLTEAEEKTTRWTGIMEGLKRVVPAQTWLTSLTVEGQGEAARVMHVTGVTVNQSRVGETMYRLTQQPDYYTKVDLRYTRTTKNDERDDVEFELAAELNQPELEMKARSAGATQTN
jgi:Tfp pilus assembly protein PilN